MELLVHRRAFAGVLTLLVWSLGQSLWGADLPQDKPSVRAQEKATPSDADKEECLRHLRTINEAIQAYRKDHKEIPNWLSDLAPQYVTSQVLLCPISKRTGRTHPFGISDPKIANAYLYEFSPAEMGNIWGGGSISMRAFKRKQMGLVGGKVPIVRCHLHNPVLNLAFDGSIYESPTTWEELFTDVVDLADFSPANLFERERAETRTANAPREKPSESKSEDLPANFSSPAEEFRALASKYEKAQRDFSKVYSAAKTDAERQEAMAKYPRPDTYSKRFLELAEKNPEDAMAVDALVWVVSHGGHGSILDSAVRLLLRDHVQDRKLGQVCQRLVYSQSREAEKLLRAVLEKNPDPSVQGQACLSLAQVLQRRSSPEAEKLFNRVIEQYGDIKHYRGTLAEAAKGELFELHHLAIGKVAPDIEGEDVDGNRFKLSDYRGKVVVIDFWGDW